MHPKEKRTVSMFSIITLIVSILGIGLYALIASTHSRILIIIFIIFAVASIILPPISKMIRLKQNKLGMTPEIISILIGGFNFYCVIFAFTQISIIFAYLGWVICGVVYGVLGKKYNKKKPDTAPIKYPKSERHWRKRIKGINEIILLDDNYEKQQRIIEYLYSRAYLSSSEKTDLENFLSSEELRSQKSKLQKYLMIPTDETTFITTWTDERIEKREDALKELSNFQGTKNELRESISKFISDGVIFEDESIELSDEIMAAADEKRPVVLSIYSLMDYKGMKDAANQSSGTHPFLQTFNSGHLKKTIETVDTKNDNTDDIAETKGTSSTNKQFIYTETPDGFSVRIPTDRVEEWKAAQEKRIRENGPTDWNKQIQQLQEHYQENIVADKSITTDSSNEIITDHKKSASPSKKLFCRKCGEQLLPDSIFCNHCGTKVIRIENIENIKESQIE